MCLEPEAGREGERAALARHAVHGECAAYQGHQPGGDRPKAEPPETAGEVAASVTPSGGLLDPEAFIHQRLGPDSCDLYKETQRELDRVLLPRVLEYTCGNQARAALLLGIARRTLRQKLRDLGLYVMHSVEADGDNLP